MTITLNWLFQTQSKPEPTGPAFVQASTRPGVGAGELALGCGIVAPFQRDGKGDFLNGCAEVLVRASVERILGVLAMSDTTHGDLEWMPEFGSLMDRIRHSNATEGVEDLARYYVVDALRIWEPRINIIDSLVRFVEHQEPGSPKGTAAEIDLLYDIVGKRRSTGVLVPNVNQTVTLVNGFQQQAA